MSSRDARKSRRNWQLGSGDVNARPAHIATSYVPELIWKSGNWWLGSRMLRSIGLIAMAVVVVSCSPESDVTGTANKCASKLFPSYNPKDLKQCIDACIKCENGVTTTCSTSCTLKGAH
jgi:hypothetical protein